VSAARRAFVHFTRPTVPERCSNRILGAPDLNRWRTAAFASDTGERVLLSVMLGMCESYEDWQALKTNRSPRLAPLHHHCRSLAGPAALPPLRLFLSSLFSCPPIPLSFVCSVPTTTAPQSFPSLHQRHRPQTPSQAGSTVDARSATRSIPRSAWSLGVSRPIQRGHSKRRAPARTLPRLRVRRRLQDHRPLGEEVDDLAPRGERSRRFGRPAPDSRRFNIALVRARQDARMTMATTTK
jgi:hypothetical protein